MYRDLVTILSLFKDSFSTIYLFIKLLEYVEIKIKYQFLVKYYVYLLSNKYTRILN